MHTIACPTRFTNEPPHQRAQHAEVARRYAWHALRGAKFGRGSPPLLCRKRLRELERLYRTRHGGYTITPDSAGFDYVKIAAQHIAHFGGDAHDHIVSWTLLWMPAISRECAEAIARNVLEHPIKFKAATLGWRLRLTDKERTALGITTIRASDISEADKRKRQKARRRDQMRVRREIDRINRPPAPPSLTVTKPWEALGMSRATWYRHGKPNPETAPPETTPVTSSRLLLCASPPASHPVAAPQGVADDRGRGEVLPSRPISPAAPKESKEVNMSGQMKYNRPRFRTAGRDLVQHNDEGTRTAWGTPADMVRCVGCGKLAPLSSRALPKDRLKCSRCGRRQTVSEARKNAKT